MAASATPHALAADLARVAAALRRITVEVRATGPTRGAGVIWRADGLVVTSAHVVASNHRVRAGAMVVLADGRCLPGALVAWDPRIDVAVLRIAAGDLPPATLGDPARLRPGDLVLAVGHPFGLAGAVVTGIVHAAAARDQRTGRRWIQADLRLAPGYSGGPMADATGHVIGVNTMIAGGLALTVPSHVVEAFVVRSVGP